MDDVRLDVLFRGLNLYQYSLIQARNGLFYGAGTGLGSYGTVFRMTPSGAVTVLHQFRYGDGAPLDLVEGTDGNIYGTTDGGGRFYRGTVFRMTPAGEVTTLHEFSGRDGAYPRSLTQARNGVLYGMASTEYRGASVFWITTEGVFGTLATLPEDVNFSTKEDLIIQAADGNFMVATRTSIFRVAPDGTTTLVHGSLPYPTILQATDGNFYGTAADGIFRLTPDGTFTLLYPLNFEGSRLIQGTDGNFYALSGALYRITPTGAASVVHTFTSAEGFRFPNPPLVGAFDGSLYGVGIGDGPEWESFNGLVYRLSGLMGPPGVIPPSVKGDLDGNGTADIVLRQAQTGDLWLLTSAAGTAHPAPANYVPGVPLAWRVVAIADVDGDGKSDLIWQDDLTGDVAVWLMSGGQPRRAQIVAFGVPLAWRIVGAADLDGDHKADLIWRHAESGDVAVWLLDGVVIRRGPVVAPSVSLAWQIVDVADVDGDGRSDLIWRHRGTGDVAVWLMDGETVKQSTVVASGVPLAWQVAGVGDVDGDGKADLVWRHVQNGEVAIWLLDGARVRASPVIAVGVPLTFQVAKVADVDGDGRADLTWRHAEPAYGSATPTVDFSAWLMNGVRVTQGVFMLSSLPDAWQIQ